MNAQEYLEQLAQTSGLNADDKAALLKVASANATFAKGLEDSVMMRSDYSRQSDALKAEKQKTADYYTQLTNWYQEQEAAYGARSAAQPIGEDVNKRFADLEKRHKEDQQRTEQVFIGLLSDGMELASQHAVEFKERLDTAALKKIAQEKSLTLRQAYDELVGPRRLQAQENSFNERLKQAREEGAREFASRNKIPIDTTPREPEYGRPNFDGNAGLPDYDGTKQQGRLTNAQSAKLRDSFVEAYTSAGGAGGSTT